MKMVLEDKDRRKMWYRGMADMTPGEIDDLWKSTVKGVAVITLMFAVMVAAYIFIMWWDTETWENNSGKVIGLSIGMTFTHIMYSFCYIDTMRQRRKLVKEEKGVMFP